jgi:hypothetical protein
MNVIPERDFATKIGIALRNGLSFYRVLHPVPKIIMLNLKIVHRHEQRKLSDGFDVAYVQHQIERQIGGIGKKQLTGKPNW